MTLRKEDAEKEGEGRRVARRGANEMRSQSRSNLSPSRDDEVKREVQNRTLLASRSRGSEEAEEGTSRPRVS